MFDLALSSPDASRLDQAEALAIGVIALNRERLVEKGATLADDGDYDAGVVVKRLGVLAVSGPTSGPRRLRVEAELELEATRALRSEEGRPIERILGPGRTPLPGRTVDVTIEVTS